MFRLKMEIKTNHKFWNFLEYQEKSSLFASQYRSPKSASPTFLSYNIQRNFKIALKDKEKLK